MRFVCAFLLVGNAPSLRAAEPKTFRAGAATSNISPWLGLSINGNFTDHIATNIHDELHARCLVLDDGRTQFAFVVVDSCMVPREIFDLAKQLVHGETSILQDHILMSATHAHSAPAATGVFQSEPDPAYQDFLARRIADGVRRALNNLAPARIAWGSAQVAGQVFNRRYTMRPGTVMLDPFGGTNDLVKMNPGVGNTNVVEAAGPTDPEVSFISVTSTNGTPLAVLANYSLHYCGGIGPGNISADYYGMFADRLQQLLGADRQDPGFVAIMSNGTSGNINNVNVLVQQPNQPPYGQMKLVANEVAEAVFKSMQKLSYRDWVPIATKQTEISLSVRRPKPQEVERAEQSLALAKESQLRTPEQVYARETVLMNDYPPQVDLIHQAVRIGDLAIAAIPCEVFVEI
ncbi:MAG: Neutral/alkaline non-lysosomal ceramidase, partial [Verrucomicrobiales bacterium]|nr:Neutral/alkaline non-lysosomal ceramidase [Verrucomicrobiales bacterium]